MTYLYTLQPRAIFKHRICISSHECCSSVKLYCCINRVGGISNSSCGCDPHRAAAHAPPGTAPPRRGVGTAEPRTQHGCTDTDGFASHPHPGSDGAPTHRCPRSAEMRHWGCSRWVRGAGRASQRAFPAPLTPRSSHGRVPALRTSPCDWAQNRTLYGRAQNRTAPQSARTAPSHRTAAFRGGPRAGRGRPAPPPDLIDSAAVHWERRGRGLRTAGGSRRGRGGPTAAARSGAAVRRFGPIRPANVRL